MIGVSEHVIRHHARRVSNEPHHHHHQQHHVDRAAARSSGLTMAMHADTNDANTKHQLIDNLLSSSPPLPAPPVMQPAQIQAQERELELQMSRLHQPRAAHRASVIAMTIDPAYAAPAMPPNTQGGNSASKSRVGAAAPPVAATSDWFAKVAVAPRPAAAVASFVPSSLAAALTDSGMLFKARDEFARVSTREIRDVRREPDLKSSDTLTIFLHPYSDRNVRPVRVRLQIPNDRTPPSDIDGGVNRNPTSDEILASLLQKWSSGELRTNFGLRATLQPAAATVDKWSLRMVDEDTIDDGDSSDDDGDVLPGEGSSSMESGCEIGMPEEDLPPLERNKPVKMFGVTTLAMTVADGVDHKMPPAGSMRPASPTTMAPPAGLNTSPNGMQPSSRNPAASVASPNNQANIKRLDALRLSSPNSGSPTNGGKVRAVSIFSSAGALSPTNHDPSGGDDRHASSQHAMSHDPSRMSIIGGDPTSPTSAREPKFYLKIHIGDHESHILGLLKSQLLADALPLLSAKKHALVAMKADHYRFFYVDPLLRSQNDSLKDMTRVLIGSLASDELNLVPKLASSTNESMAMTTPSVMEETHQGGQTGTTANHHHGSILASTEAPSLSSFQFSLDTASNYCEYKVIKTNQRGKRQHRIFGMDRYKIYNKTVSGADENESGGMFSFIQRRISSDQGVSRAFRLINTIASVHVVSLRPTCFCINFKADSRKDSPIVQSREYETETKMECAEVVAKLRFLISHAQPDTFPTGPSLANTGLLAQSIK